MTRLAELVGTSAAVAATSSRTAKIAAISDLLARLDPAEVEAAVCLLSGEPRQGRIGVGWSAASSMPEGTGADGEIDILELDRAISRLQETTGPGSVGARTALLAELASRATPAETSFLRRLFTGELRQGALEGIMADAVAKAAGVPAAAVRRAAMLGGDLGRAATAALTEGRSGLGAIGLRVLHPVSPMLASTADSVEEAVAGTGPASVEWKLDGIRVQVHRLGDEVRIYTRNLNDVTDRLPEVCALVASFPSSAIVLDGETILLSQDRRPEAFQETMSRVGRQGGDGGRIMAAWFFDVLHCDGRDLFDLPLRDRAAILDAQAGSFRIPGVSTDDPTAARAVLHEALSQGHEGVMVKALDSTYQAGRRGKSWRKVKPVRTLDLVVIGVEWGSGRRKGWLSNLHLGARDPASGGFVMVGKTFKGMTDDLLAWQTNQLLARETGREGHVVWVRPELVVEIALDGVQRSPRYPGGVALRFARVKGYRPDKGPADADTIDTVRSLKPA